MNADVNIILSDDERQPVECWTRVMGYLRPVSQFNKGKQSEFNERKWFTEEKAFAAPESCSCCCGSN
jgi:hypothetical protein